MYKNLFRGFILAVENCILGCKIEKIPETLFIFIMIKKDCSDNEKHNKKLFPK